jgi:hypothetical protein
MSVDKSRHVFGSEPDVDLAIEQGLIDAYDILFLSDGRIGWVDRGGNKIIDDIGMQPDWNQSNPEAKDFIKNKPFGVDRTVLFDNIVVVRDDGNGTVNGSVELAFSEQLFRNREYEVTFNGERFVGIAEDWETENGFYVKDADGNDLFNVCTNKGRPPATGFIWFYPEKYDSGDEVKIVVSEYKVVKISDEFISDSLVDGISSAQDIANAAMSAAQSAESVANNIKNAVDNKMEATDPVGSGAFSMNRRPGTPIGRYSHAEGYDTEAHGDYSHAEGYRTIAKYGSESVSGSFNIEEPKWYIEKKDMSLAGFGHYYSVVYSSDYTVSEDGVIILENVTFALNSDVPIGKYYNFIDFCERKTDEDGNIYIEADWIIYKKSTSDGERHEVLNSGGSNHGKYIQIVGNGTSDTARSNAHTLDWGGNAWYQGDVYVGGGGQDEDSKKLATESYVNTQIEAIPTPDVSGQISAHNTATDAHKDIRLLIENLSDHTGGNVDLTGYATEQYVKDYAQPKGDYLTKVPEGYAKTEDIPTKPEDIGAQPAGNYLTEVPGGYATEEFVTNKIAEAELGGKEVDLSGYAQKSELPTKVSQLQNDSGYLTAVPDGYAKTEDIPKNASDIGAQPEGDYALRSEIPSVPVKSVNGKTGAVILSASDVGARPDNWMPTVQEVGALPSTYTPPNQTAEQVGADPKGTAASAVSQHNTADDSHSDIRLELKAINDRLTAFFDSDNQTLDELSEIVAYITSNKSLIDSITTSKVSVADIVNNLTSNVSNKPLSAAQGVVLKGLIDAVSNSLANYQPKGDYALKSQIPTVPTKISAFENDKGYLTEHQDISGKLDASALPTAINTALAQAKANGEFDGKDGTDGEDGFSPIATVTQTDTGAVISITDKDGTTTATITNGKDGVDGKDGSDGYTPVKGKDYFDGKDGKDGSPGSNGSDGVSATHSWNGTVLTVTSASGTSSADLKGAKGDKGDKGDSIKGDTGATGADGVSPTVAVSKSGKVTTVSITDKNGTKTATINDGADGSPGSAGKDGTSVTVTKVTESTADGGSNVVTFSDGKTLTVKNGKTGATGGKGADGKTPVKGTDYYTEADKTEMVNAVLEALPTWTGGSY